MVGPWAGVERAAAQGMACTTGDGSQELWSDVLWNEVGEGDLEGLSP